MILFYKHRRMYLFLHIYLIKAGTEVVEDLSLRRIDPRFRFFNHWSGIDPVLVCNPKELISSHDIIFEPLPSLLICTRIFYQSRYRSV